MDIGQQDLPLVQLNFAFIGLAGRETVVLRLPDGAGASLAMLTDRPTFELGMSYGDWGFSISELVLQPQRLMFTVIGAPARLPLTLRVHAPGPFLFGSLQVGENVETVVATTAERVRILGPGYWAVPVPPIATTTPKSSATTIARAAPTRFVKAPPARKPAPRPASRPAANPTPAKPPPKAGPTDTKAK